MKKLILILALFASGCAFKTLGTQVVYEGPLDGDYPQSTAYVVTCQATQMCMGLEGEDYPLPSLKLYGDGNAVQCAQRVSNGCYWADQRIEITTKASLGLVAHECVHHYLLLSTGDLDAEHKSPWFGRCGY